VIIESPELVDEMTAEDESAGENSAFLLSAEERAGIRVLVIDDEQTILESCESVLATEGYQVTVERRADEALQRLASSKFEIVIIDQNMPHTNGFDILDEVRRRRPDALSLMMTFGRCRRGPGSTFPSRSPRPSCWS
jgi:PleD family two-component response regulator